MISIEIKRGKEKEEEKEQNKNTFSPRSGKLELPPSQPGACESGVRACPGRGGA